jgi:tetratricopeptide (TPR) repeat protein
MSDELAGPRTGKLATLGRLVNIVRAGNQQAIVDEAVASGQVEASVVASMREQDDGEAGSLVAQLVAAGHLDAARLPELERAVARHAFERPSLARTTRLPAEVAAHAGEPERCIAEFVLAGSIARGGAGEVWKAWDTRHERWVAVKIGALALDRVDAAARFEREVRAAARLAHPHIVSLFQSGVDRGRPFLVMPLLEGKTLAEARLTARMAITTVRTVALAIEYAHTQGVLHRDLKPGNILLDRAGQPFVLDFGLAFLREEEAKVTRPGDVFGTAAYLAPEQARGDAAPPTPATDVYGLGATLYHAITGRPPFAGRGVGEIAARVITEDPVPPHRLVAGVDKRLELVITKAMDKDPSRRYATAAAFAEDLRRLLDGEQISVHREGPLARLVRASARRPALTAAVVLAVIALGLVAAQARGRAERAAAVESMRDMATVSLEAALRLRRAGDLAGMRLTLPRVLQAYERARSRGAATAEVEHIMGRMYRALLDNDTALAFQERALAREPNLAPALYERAVLLAARYGQAARTRLNWRGTEKREDVALQPEEQALRERVLADFRRLETLPIAKTQALVVRAFVAFHDLEHEHARRMLADVVAREPEREEAWLMLGRSLVRLNLMNEADRAFTDGLAHDRGFLPLLLGRCQVRAHLRSPGSLLDAITDADTVLALDLGSSEASNYARVCRGLARMFQGHEQMVKGQDPTANFRSSEDDYSAVLAQPNPGTEAIWGRGTLRRYRAMFNLRRGGDGELDLSAAEADFDRGLASDPRDVDLWIGRGRTRSRRAFYRLDNSKAAPNAPDAVTAPHALAELDAAEADFTHALGLWPRKEALEYRGEVRAYRAGARARAGDFAGARADFAAAESDFQQFVNGDTGFEWARLRRATMLRLRGQARLAIGESPLPDWREAEVELERAAALLNDVADLWVERARLHLARARVGGAPSRGAKQELDRARGALASALAIEPQYSDAIAERDHLPSR